MDNTCETKSACSVKLKEKIRGNIPALAGTLMGAVGGYVYYRFAGCSTGTCLITSNPWISTLWGAVLGNLIIGIFITKTNKKNEKEHGTD